MGNRSFNVFLDFYRIILRSWRQPIAHSVLILLNHSVKSLRMSPNSSNDLFHDTFRSVNDQQNQRFTCERLVYSLGDLLLTYRRAEVVGMTFQPYHQVGSAGGRDWNVRFGG